MNNNPTQAIFDSFGVLITEKYTKNNILLWRVKPANKLFFNNFDYSFCRTKVKFFDLESFKKDRYFHLINPLEYPTGYYLYTCPLFYLLLFCDSHHMIESFKILFTTSSCATNRSILKDITITTSTKIVTDEGLILEPFWVEFKELETWHNGVKLVYEIFPSPEYFFNLKLRRQFSITVRAFFYTPHIDQYNS